jgi:Na+-translocating ferredoxin:NAD+ oxidoreductase RnfC subunit
MNLEELKDKILENGIVGAGGAGFPTDKKLSDKAEVIILNCAECEPLFRVDRQLIEIYCKSILESLSLVIDCCNAKKGVIAIKSSYKDAIKAVGSNIFNYKNLELKILPDVYPAGDEVILIYEVTGKIVPEGSIPLSVGIIVFNVETMLNVYKGIYSNKPVVEKYVTVGGEVRNPVTVKVPIGISVNELIDLAGGTELKEFEIIMGGPMTGKLVDINSYITKTTKGVLIFPKDHPLIVKRHENSSINLKRVKSVCSQCRMCTDLCPRYLLGHSIRPNRIMNALGNEVVSDIEAYTATMLCSACGLCEMYSCHQGLSPRMLISELKSKLIKNGIKNPHRSSPDSANYMREYRMVPEERIVSRLGLSKYDSDAILDNKEINIKRVELMLNQHIGSPCIPVVKVGDLVNKYEVIADIEKGKLGAKLHASINGEISEVSKNSIIIESRGELNG